MIASLRNVRLTLLTKITVSWFFWMLLLPTTANAQVCTIVGDVDCNGIVDLADVIIIINNYSRTNPTNPRADLNGDGIVNLFDFGIVVKNYVLSSTSPTPTPVPSPSGGVLQFKSNFESSTYLTSASDLGYILGTDNSVTDGNNNWNNISQFLPWAKFQRLFSEGGSWSIGADPVNSINKVLHFHNINQVGGISRSQWSIKSVNQWTDDGTPNLFDKQFYRVRMYIPDETSTTYARNETSLFYMIWESHAWEPASFSGGENTRYGVYIDKFANQDFWHFRVVKQRPEGLSNCTICWLSCSVNSEWCDVNHKVPFGKWFTFEIFFKYAVSDGEFFVAYTEEGKPRQIVGHFKGQTKYDQKIHDHALFKLYHDQDFLNRLPSGTHQYYDNLEIWSDYPPGYWE